MKPSGRISPRTLLHLLDQGLGPEEAPWPGRPSAGRSTANSSVVAGCRKAELEEPRPPRGGRQRGSRPPPDPRRRPRPDRARRPPRSAAHRTPVGPTATPALAVTSSSWWLPTSVGLGQAVDHPLGHDSAPPRPADPSPARQVVAAKRPTESPSEGALVTPSATSTSTRRPLVTERVIDVLESVEVDEQHRRPGSWSRRERFSMVSIRSRVRARFG